MIIKPVSILAITIVGLMSAFPSNGAPMTSQIQRLLEQKEEKVKKLEECEGKKQGWMIAGISTIGLTAVGVGVNIAQASKSNRLSGEIEQSKQELERQQERLSRIEGQISKKEQEAKAERERAEQKAIPGATPVVVSNQDLSKFISGSKEIGFNTVQELVEGIRSTYSDISIECGNKYAYAFIPGDENGDDFKRVKDECVTAGGEDFVKIETKNITKPDGTQSVDVYQCKAEWRCDTVQTATLANNQTKQETLTTIDIKPKSAEVLTSDNLDPDKLPLREVPTVKSDVTVAEKIAPIIEDNKDMALQIPSWFNWDELQNPSRDPNYWSQSDACEKIKYSNIGTIEFSQNLLSLKDKYEYALGAGYWCRQFGGEWSVNVYEDRSGAKWKCEIDDESKCPQGTEPRQVNDSGNRDGEANRLLEESILEQKCSDGVEKNPMPLIFEYYCVGTTERECEELKTAFESADLPVPDVEFKAEIKERLFPSGTRTIKNVCVVYLI